MLHLSTETYCYSAVHSPYLNSCSASSGNAIQCTTDTESKLKTSYSYFNSPEPRHSFHFQPRYQFWFAKNIKLTLQVLLVSA